MEDCGGGPSPDGLETPPPPRPEGLERPWLSEQAGSGSSSRPGQADFQHFQDFHVFLFFGLTFKNKKCSRLGLPGTPGPSQALPDPPRPSQTLASSPFHGLERPWLSEQAGSGSLSRPGQAEFFFGRQTVILGSPGSTKINVSLREEQCVSELKRILVPLHDEFQNCLYYLLQL